jgi:hypothetical protein
MLGSFFTDLLEKHLLSPVVYLVVQNEITIFREKPFLRLVFYRTKMILNNDT